MNQQENMGIRFNLTLEERFAAAATQLTLARQDLEVLTQAHRVRNQQVFEGHALVQHLLQALQELGQLVAPDVNPNDCVLVMPNPDGPGYSIDLGLRAYVVDWLNRTGAPTGNQEILWQNPQSVARKEESHAAAEPGPGTANGVDAGRAVSLAR